MEFGTYLKESGKTLSSNLFCSTDIERDYLHMCMGLVTEVDEIIDSYNKAELDLVNLREEIGDLCFYLSIYYRHNELPKPYIYIKDEYITKSYRAEEVVMDMVSDSCKALDILKKKVFYDRPIDTDALTARLQSMYSSILYLCEIYEFDIKEIYHINIAKLRKRYNNSTFSSDNAINRDLDGERTILEGNDK